MPDWTKSMRQTYEYYVVDPDTWYDDRKLNSVESCSISWALNASTLGSASFVVSEELDECYIRVYLVTEQDGIKERFPLGAFLVQSPSKTFDGRYSSVTMDGYTPLIELKDKKPSIGYGIKKGENIMDRLNVICEEQLRAPVVPCSSSSKISSNYVADVDESWLDYISSLLSYANKRFDLDAKSNVLFASNIELTKMQPVFTFNDDNSSILAPNISLDKDLYGIPNVVEVVYSTNDRVYFSRVRNTDSGSPISVKNRGREVVYRDTNPSIEGTVTQALVNDYAKNLLEELSTVKYTLSYTHGYCPTVRIGDCVRLNYSAAGLENIKARVETQDIECVSGCQVTETATYVSKLWGGN